MTGRLAPARPIDAAELLGSLAPAGGLFTGIPCSHLGAVFSEARTSARWRLVSPASEGEAVAIACGAVGTGGAAVVAMQNSGLGSALDPLVSLAIPAGIPIPLVVSHRGHPDVESLAHHALMGAVTVPLLQLAGVRAITLRDDGTAGVEALAAEAAKQRQPYAVVVRRGDLATPAAGPYPAERPDRTAAESGRPAGDHDGAAGDGLPVRRAHDLEHARDGAPVGRRAALAALLDRRPAGTVLVASTGHISRELYAIADDERNVYLSGSMGYASAFGLGVSLQHPDLGVLVVEGDGSALMHLGSMATIGAAAGGGLRHVVLDNGVHGSTGGQPTSSSTVDFPALARAAGYRSVADDRALGSPAVAADWLFSAAAPALLHVRIAPEPGDRLPRIGVGLDEQLARLTSWAGRAR